MDINGNILFLNTDKNINLIICIILLIVIIIIYDNLKKNNNITKVNKINQPTHIIKKNVSKINNINNNNFTSMQIFKKKFDENGGSKPFSNIVINNDNLTANQVNYTLYESYRKKPLKK